MGTGERLFAVPYCDAGSPRGSGAIARAYRLHIKELAPGAPCAGFASFICNATCNKRAMCCALAQTVGGESGHTQRGRLYGWPARHPREDLNLYSGFLAQREEGPARSTLLWCRRPLLWEGWSAPRCVDAHRGQTTLGT